MKKIFWCKKCVVMSTRPRVTFNAEGVCSACQWAEEKKKLDWKAKISLHEGLSQTFDWYINNKSFFDSVSKKLHINRLGLKS